MTENSNKTGASPAAPEVLAAARLWPPMMESLRAAFHLHDRSHQTDPAGFAAAAPRIRAIAASGESRVSRELIAQLPALEIISVFGVGYDGIDVAAAHERGIHVTNTPDVLTDEVADMAIGLMLAIARRIPQADRYIRANKWPEGGLALGRKVSGARLGLVGFGRIGQAIARRADSFGMSIAYTARGPKAGTTQRFYPDAATLAEAVDFLVVITPGGAGTRKLIDAPVLAALGKDGYLVNVARGSVVDERALVDALQRGTIAGAALDVFENEPHVPPELFVLDNVVLTPHIGSATWQTRRAMADLAFGNLQAHFAGRPLLSPVPPTG